MLPIFSYLLNGFGVTPSPFNGQFPLNNMEIIYRSPPISCDLKIDCRCLISNLRLPQSFHAYCVFNRITQKWQSGPYRSKPKQVSQLKNITLCDNSGLKLSQLYEYHAKLYLWAYIPHIHSVFFISNRL